MTDCEAFTLPTVYRKEVRRCSKKAKVVIVRKHVCPHHAATYSRRGSLIFDADRILAESGLVGGLR
jgi:hypothetical protein